jgi:translation initiation factor IF-3
VDTKEALRLAREKGLDLVEIASTSTPPVCKIMDYGKFLYDSTKRVKDSKKKQVSNDLKTMKIGLNIGEGDFEVKIKQIRDFLESGDKVKIVIMYRGREIIYKNQGFDMLDKIANAVQEMGKIERRPKLEGKNLVSIISPVSKKGS